MARAEGPSFMAASRRTTMRNGSTSTPMAYKDPEKARQKSREYYEANREELLQYRKEYVEKHATDIKKYQKQYRERNREELRNKNKDTVRP
jgi:hypothetical protein